MKHNAEPLPRLTLYTGLRFRFLCILVAATTIFLSSCDFRKNYKFEPDSLHWMQFRGPDASGIALENADPPIHFNADTNLLWKTEILPGWSSPCIINDKIFLTGFNDPDSLLYVISIDRENGNILWRDSLMPKGIHDIHPVNSYANPTIASDGERIFAEFLNYGMIAYDLEGNRLWEYPHERISDYFGGACSPIIIDSAVALKISAWKDSRIMGLDCERGYPLWSIRSSDHNINMGSNSTLIFKDSLIVNHGPGMLWAFNLKKNEVEWQIPVPGSGVATPVFAGEDIILNTYVQLGEEKARGKNIAFEVLLEMIDENKNGLAEPAEFPVDMKLFNRPEIIGMERSSMYFREDRVLQYFDSNKNGAYDENEWNSLWEMMAIYMEEHGMMAISVNGKGERSIDDIKWKVNEDTPETPSPLVVKDHVFYIKNGGLVTVIHRESGNVVLKERLGAPGAYLSSPLLAGNRIYTCSFNGTITVISADDYSVLANNKLKEKIGASPVAVDDVLYLRTDKHMYAFR